MRKEIDMGNDGVFPLVLKFAIPAMIAQAVNVLYCIIDRMFIGNIPIVGDLALAGVGICGPIVTLLSSFGTLVGVGGSILMAMHLGTRNKIMADKVLANSFVMLLVFSVILTTGFLLVKNPLLMAFGATDVTFVYANTYMTIYAAGTCFALLAVGLNSFITCQGFAATAMITVLVGAVTNIALDYIFVIVIGWGVAGAAWATVISQILSCSYALYFLLFSKRARVRITFKGYCLKTMKRIATFGLSPFIITASDSVIIIFMNAMLKQYAPPAEADMFIASMTIVQSFLLLITGPMLGITVGTQAIISYNYGAGNMERIRKTVRYVLILCLVFTSTMFAIGQTVPHIFVGIFTKDPQYAELSIWGIKIFTLGLIPLAINYTIVDGLTALGRTKTALALSLFRKTIYFVCVAFLPIVYGAKSAFFAEPICNFLGVIIYVTVFCLTFKKHLNKRSNQLFYEQ